MPERQGVRQGCRATSQQLEAPSDLVDARPRSSAGRRNRRACSSRFCAHGQFAVEREGLRHVADAPAGLDVLRRRPACRTAAPRPRSAGSRPVSIFIVVVLPQPLEPRKPKISPRSMRKLDMVDRDEVAEAHGQAAAPRSRRRRRRLVARRQLDRAMVRAALLGQQRDEGLLERRRCRCGRAGRAACPSARMRPASIATSQSKRAASSM